MIVVFPPSIRHDDGIIPSYYEDHLLERVSLLELRLAQVSEQLAMAYEFISREAKTFQKDHTLLQSFFETIHKINPDLSDLISKNTLEIFDDKKEKLRAEDRHEQILAEILAGYDHKQTDLLTHLFKESVKLLARNEDKQAFTTLERAALLSPRNVPLLNFVAGKLFRADRFDDARKYLETAFECAPHNEKALFLLGTIYADEAQAEKARRLLSVLVNIPEKSLCINYIWGMLAAFEQKWAESLAAFKQSAGGNEEIPELEYLIGCAYFQLENHKSALHHLQKATSTDIKYADAWFMQSLIYNLSGSRESAKNTRQAAFDAREAGAQCLEFLKGKQPPDFETSLPFLHLTGKNHLLTKGSVRLNKFFREQIFKFID